MLMGDQYLSDEDAHPPMNNDLEEDTETLIAHKSVYDSGVAVSLTSQSGVYFMSLSALLLEHGIYLSVLGDGKFTGAGIHIFTRGLM